LSSHRQSFPIACAVALRKIPGPGPGSSAFGSSNRYHSRSASALSQMWPSHEVALFDKSLAKQTRTASTKTGSAFDFFGRMNAALLKRTPIRGGTSFCPLASIGSLAHPSQPSTRYSYSFGGEHDHQNQKCIISAGVDCIPVTKITSCSSCRPLFQKHKRHTGLFN